MIVIVEEEHLLIPFSLYSELIKGKQTFLLLFTGIFAYLISAYRDNYDGIILLILLISLFLSVSGSTLLNMYWDRDIDAKMERTKYRALPSGKISSSSVLLHGLLFSIVGLMFAYLINPLTTLIIFAGLFFDVFVYTILLKRKTKWSIIFGGISGGLPALAGRTAVINQIDLLGILFVLIILFWIPLHILTLALIPKNLDGYIEAEIPMWPVVSGVNQTRIVISIAALLDAITIMATGFVLDLHWFARIPQIIMGVTLIYLALKNLIYPSYKRTFTLFKFASIFMALTFMQLFVAVMVSPRLPVF